MGGGGAGVERGECRVVGAGPGQVGTAEDMHGAHLKKDQCGLGWGGGAGGDVESTSVPFAGPAMNSGGS